MSKVHSLVKKSQGILGIKGHEYVHQGLFIAALPIIIHDWQRPQWLPHFRLDLRTLPMLNLSTENCSSHQLSTKIYLVCFCASWSNAIWEAILNRMKNVAGVVLALGMHAVLVDSSRLEISRPPLCTMHQTVSYTRLWKYCTCIYVCMASKVIYTRVNMSRSSLAHTHPAHAHSLFFIFTRQPLLLIVQ
jgi:hypothetical protein